MSRHKQKVSSPISAPTAEELMAGVRAAIVRPPDDIGFTAQQYADDEAAKGRPITVNVARAYLDKAAEQGAILVGLAYRPRSDGHYYRQRVYRPVGT